MGKRKKKSKRIEYSIIVADRIDVSGRAGVVIEPLTEMNLLDNDRYNDQCKNFLRKKANYDEKNAFMYPVYRRLTVRQLLRRKLLERKIKG